MNTLIDIKNIESLVAKNYEGGKLYWSHYNEVICKKDYEKAARKGWLGLFMTVCMAGLFCLYLSVYTDPTFNIRALAVLSDDERQVLSLYYYGFLLGGTPIVFLLSAHALRSSSESLSNISYFEENPEGIRKIEASKQSMEEFANDKQILSTVIKHVDSQQLLKLITADTTQYWAKKIMEEEAQERAKWLYNPFIKY